MKRRSILLSAGLVLLIASFWMILRLSHSGSDTTNFDRFNSFPIGRKIVVNITLTDGLDKEYTDREKNDQVKDWLLFTALSDAGLSNNHFNQVTYDLPATRQGYNRNVYNLDYGDTRSRYIGKGTVVAVIPACSGVKEIDYLAHIADEQRKNLGEKPVDLQVFQYQIDLASNKASLIHVAAPLVKDLFTPEAGYFEQTVTNLNDLAHFLSGIEDVTYASEKSGTLIVGGRKLKSSSGKNIKIEDIAAIWQSEKDIKQKKDDFDQKWDSKTYATDEEKEALIAQRDSELQALKLVNGSGFSLDPVFEYDLVSEYLERVKKDLIPSVTALAIDSAEKELANQNIDPLFEIITRLTEDSDPLKKELGDALQKDVFSLRIQKARYDGDLKGTEVGMHLFYTDLLAKLWCIDFIQSSPGNIINDFINDPKTAVELPKIYSKEAQRFPSARLWFGPNSLGYQIADENKELLFARNATKIFSASSNPLTPGKEVKTAALFDASTDWWNNHYEEVAGYEKEYQALNEIMKWSVIIGWLNANDQSDALNFLANVTVNHDYWFSDWVKAQKNLKFDEWDKINFYSKNYKGFDTETLPLLSSASFYTNIYKGKGDIKGGVSLAEESALKEVKALPSTASDLIRRSNLDYAQVGDELKTIKGNTFSLVSDESNFKVVSKAEGDAILRSKFGELSNNSFEKDLFTTTDGLSLKARFNENSIGDLDIQKTKNGFSVGFYSRDVDKGQQLAKEISDSADPETFLKENSDVEAYLKLPETGEYLVKQNGTTKWMHLKMEDEAEVSLPDQWDSRVSGNNEYSKVCNLKWLNEKEISGITRGNRIALGKDGQLGFEAINPASQKSMIPIGLTGGKTTIKAYYDPASSNIIFDESAIANDKVEIASLRRLVDDDDFTAIKQKASFGKPFQYRVKKSYDVNDLLANYQDNNYDEVLSQLKNSDDLGGFKAMLAREKANDLSVLDAEADPLKSQYMMEALAKKYGNIPELEFRKGLSELASVDYTNGETLINQAIESRSYSGRMYDEVNRLIRNAGLSPENKRVLSDINAFTLDRAKWVKATFDNVPKGTEVPFSKAAQEIKAGKAVLIVQDHPSLNNLDWNVAIHNSASPSMFNPVCIRIDPQSLSGYNMQLVVHQAPATAGTGQSFHFNAVPRISSINNNQSDDDDKKKKIKYYIYIPKQPKKAISA